MYLFFIYLISLLYFFTCLHFYQWKGYYNLRYIKYIIKNKLIIIINLIFIFQIIVNILLKIINLNLFYVNLILFIINFLFLFIFIINNKKIKFIFTFKLFRIFLIYILLHTLCYFNIYLTFALLILTPLLITCIDLIDIYKYTLNYYYKTLAKNKLTLNKNLITIAITGSNGKTSIKEILNKLLSIKYKVITTQKNQNTLKGAIIAINKYLTNSTDVFVCEMGARQVGDIKQICNFVNPGLGVISSISPQHLETFKSIQNVYSTKNELPDFLENNYCVFNYDNNYCKQMYNEKLGDKSCISIKNKTNLYADNIKIVNYITYFDIHYSNNIYPCHTKLLGEHNITNILLALDIALKLKVNINSCIQQIINLTPTHHRLEYIKSHIDIIDDSYNCSIDSAQCALKVLKQINKRKVVCTPGIIEGGKNQFELNTKLSNMLNNTCDILIIVGKTNRTALISKLSNFEIINYPNQTYTSSTKKCAYIVNTLNNAKLLFNKILTSNDVLLLLNDLPDDYN